MREDLDTLHRKRYEKEELAKKKGEQESQKETETPSKDHVLMMADGKTKKERIH